MLASKAVFAGRKNRALRIGVTVAFLAVGVVPLAGPAASQSKLGDLESRMDSVQAELDAATAEVEKAYAAVESLETRKKEISAERARLLKKEAKLEQKVIERAAALYKSGSTGVLDVLLNSEDFATLSDSAEFLSQVNIDDAGVFIDMARTQDKLAALQKDLNGTLAAEREERERLDDLVSELQAKFNSVAAEYEALKEEQQAAAREAAPVVARPAPQIKASGDMVCPVAGPTSFVDSWGAPRSGGRSHQGVDMMAAYGTPQVAIVSGTITYAGYSGIGGNVQYLSGDDGNLYVYIHQSSHEVTSGHVSAGQVISYVGDTGNAAGTPHLHFEFHPGGGGAVNPYPLVSSLC